MDQIGKMDISKESYGLSCKSILKALISSTLWKMSPWEPYIQTSGLKLSKAVAADRNYSIINDRGERIVLVEDLYRRRYQVIQIKPFASVNVGIVMTTGSEF